MKRVVTILVVSAALAAILAACGGSENGAGDAAPSAAPSATVVVTITLAPEHTLPPTWTPAPTLTPPPDQPTLEITLDRPTATSFTLPTLTPRPTDDPSVVEPAAPDTGSDTIEVTLSQSTINDAVAGAVAPAIGIYFAQSPTVTLGGGWIRLTLPLLTTPGSAASLRTIAVEMSLTVVDGRVQVNLWRIYAEDTGEAFETSLSDDLVAEVQDQIDAQLAAAVGQGVRFAVVDAVVRSGEIAFTLQPLNAAPGS